MTTSVGFMRRWVMERTPIPSPQIVELDVPDLQSEPLNQSLIGQIELPLLSEPIVDDKLFSPLFVASTTHDLASVHVEVAPGDLANFVTPRTANLKLSTLEEYPKVLDLFTGLTAPGKAGKAYVQPREPQQTSSFDAKVSHASKQKTAEKCLHGLQPEQCDICSYKKAPRKRREKATKAAQTLDVFDLLLPYLQPPLDELLAHPLLFPADRRPYPYQVTGIKFLAEREAALLGDEMGLGKTIQTIIALQVLYRRGHVQQTLILCPRSLLGTWEKEITHWAPELYLLKVRGTQDERRELWQSNATVCLTTYETLRDDIKRFPALASKFQVIVLDEVQKIKNPNSGLARAVRRVRARFRWGLSGTPLENKVEDVTAIYRYLVPNLFKPDKEYMSKEVKKAIEPYFLRRRTADVRKELPPKEVTTVKLELTKAQQAAYERAEERGKRRLAEKDATRIHVFALITELKKICNIEPKSGQSCKLEYLVQQLDTIVENGQKALVFSHLPNVTFAQIAPKLKNFHPALFDGSLSDKRRESIIKDFQERSHPSILLMSVQAGGVGLTLTRANYVFHFDHWWNPATARQAEARAHRIGQKQTVFVHDLYTRNTIEERIYKLLQTKQALFDTVIDDLSAEHIEKMITDADLFGLFDATPPGDPDYPNSSRMEQQGHRLFQSQSASNGILAKSQAKTNPHQTLDGLSPIEFEHFIAGLYTRMGYKARVTGQSRDHGVDVRARRATHLGGEELIIQCKHYPNGVVGEAEIRDLVGAWQAHRQAQYAILVTSGRYSNDAVKFAQEHQVTIIDRQDLLQLLQKYGWE